MNQNEHWETQLRSWTPRRPSARIAGRLFAPADQGWAGWHRSPVASWLAPVTACFLSLLVVLNGTGRSPLHSGQQTRDRSLFAAVMVNASSNLSQLGFALCQNDPNLEWNIWPHATVPVTNGNISQFAAGSQTLIHP